MHLTNVAIQKKSDLYDEAMGGKWDLRDLKLHLLSRYGEGGNSSSNVNAGISSNDRPLRHCSGPETHLLSPVSLCPSDLQASRWLISCSRRSKW
jgi:hypothetical protein